MRWRDLAATTALGDATGPWLAALISPLGASPHAAPFGWALYPPYAICMTADSLWAAVAGMHALHALAAPLAALACLKLRPGGWAAALAVGALVAMDPGLVNTALSGSKGYLGATWLAAATLGVAARDRPWGAPLACVSVAVAAMNHPYAIAAAPLLLALRWRSRWTAAGLVAGAALLLPRALRAITEPIPGSGGLSLDLLEAGDAWLDQGGVTAWVIALAPVAGLVGRRTRPLAVGLLLSLLVAALAGLHLGYLRDYHLRLFTVPAAVGLAGLPRHWALLALLALRLPEHRFPPDMPQPGTLGLATQLTDALMEAPRPLLIDGARLGGVTAAEPSALALDLHLRGWPRSDLAPGGATALLVTARREQLATIPHSPTDRLSGDRYRLLLTGPDTVPESLCVMNPNFGGAWDWLAASNTDTTLEDAPDWSLCTASAY